MGATARSLRCSPELVLDGRSLGEPGKVLADALCKGTEEGVASKRRDADVSGDGPSQEAQHKDQGVLVEPCACMHGDLNTMHKKIVKATVKTMQFELLAVRGM